VLRSLDSKEAADLPREGDENVDVKPDMEARSLQDLKTFRITVLASNLSSGTTRMLSRTYGITLASWRTLCVLHFEGACSPSQICSKGAIDKAHMSRSLPLLEKRGLVRRKPGRTKKRYVLEITPHGTELFNTINPIARAREASLFSVLTDEELAVFDRCLSKIYDKSMELN
jgi:DNA-binding MarR family transcriptional regulator